MSKVQNVDNLIQQELNDVDTNRCQNVEPFLIMTGKRKQTSSTPKVVKKVKKKRISPPRKLLPSEERIRRGPKTRSVTRDENLDTHMISPEPPGQVRVHGDK